MVIRDVMAKPTTIDEYLRQLPNEQRRALQTLRAQIKAVVPAAEEYISYGLASFGLNGRPLIYMGAAKNHCAIYGATADDGLAEKLKGFKQSKGTIQFTPEKPIPPAVVKLIVQARVAALEQRESARKKARPAKKASAAKKKAAPAKASAANKRAKPAKKATALERKARAVKKTRAAKR